MLCDDCPYKEQIETNTQSIISLDKELAVNTSTQDVKYQTIIDLLTDIKSEKANMNKRISKLELKEPLNEYKTNKTTNLMESMTVSKIIAIAISVMVLIQMIKGA